MDFSLVKTLNAKWGDRKKKTKAVFKYGERNLQSSPTEIAKSLRVQTESL